MSPITTHVLDTSLGRPAEGIVITLAKLDEHDAPIAVGHGVTNRDGRVATLLTPGFAEPGVYRLTFETTAYFAKTHRESFYPRIEVTFHVTEGSGHYHVPLLLSPHGYTTYRGS
jgi:5-hydroxyisourate hydrolase